MRLFVAVDIPSFLKDKLSVLLEELSIFKNVKSVEKNNLHITLCFLGDLDQKEVVSFLKTLKFKPCSITTSKIQLIPDENFIRLVWLDVSSNVLKELQSSIENHFQTKKSSKIHITIARVKKLSPDEKPDFVKTVSSFKPPEASFKVDCFKLYKSTLTAVGPIYEVVESFKAI